MFVVWTVARTPEKVFYTKILFYDLTPDFGFRFILSGVKGNSTNFQKNIYKLPHSITFAVQLCHRNDKRLVNLPLKHDRNGFFLYLFHIYHMLSNKICVKIVIRLQKAKVMIPEKKNTVSVCVSNRTLSYREFYTLYLKQF